MTSSPGVFFFALCGRGCNVEIRPCAALPDVLPQL